VSVVIPGAKTPEQARANAAASDGVLLTPQDVARARTVLSGG
jgi:aryl-alcohol dehydrogenase-like predicted oxidoreductase